MAHDTEAARSHPDRSGFVDQQGPHRVGNTGDRSELAILAAQQATAFGPDPQRPIATGRQAADELARPPDGVGNALD